MGGGRGAQRPPPHPTLLHMSIVTGIVITYAITMPDSLYDNFAGAEESRRLSVIPDDVEELPIGGSPPETPQQAATATATLFAVAALAAAGAFAIIGLTTVVIAVSVPGHWFVAVAFTGAFVLVAVGTGLIAVWRLRILPRGQRLQEIGNVSRTAARAVRSRTGTRGSRRRAG